MDSTEGWNRQDSTLSAAPQDDFQQFLDMGMNGMDGGLNFDFPDFNSAHNGSMMQQDRGDAMDTTLDGDIGLLGVAKDTMMRDHLPPMTTASSISMMTTAPIDNIQPASNSLVDLDAQIHFLQQQRNQQAQRQIQQQQQQQQMHQQRNYYAPHDGMIPPTPNSTEMHSASSHFYPQSDPQHEAMFDRYQMRMKEADMAFTPLVSPAVTPLETHFNIPEYTVPGAYFSPLSSPALHAQNEHRSAYESRLLENLSHTSPIDLSIDLNSGPTSAGDSGRKSAKKAISKPRGSRSVRQSPIVKPQRKKTGSSTVIPPQTLSDILEPAIQQNAVQVQGQPRNHSSSRSGRSTEGSENESISPEHLSDMAPPPLPLPVSARNSPYLIPQNGHPSRVQQLSHAPGMSPATPASLMRIVKSNQNSPLITTHGDGDDHLMDGFSLPEAANPLHPQLSRIDTVSDGQITPTLDSSRTPGFQSLSSPSLARTNSIATMPSPMLQAQNNSVTNTPSLRKTPQLAVRGSKKRQSVSSIHVSPALLPRISPNIKPMIRSNGLAARGSMTDDTASLLLASKSNYQNILEGTHLPGVSYPTELSTNLTSKRTSHKIAEQGRRNRINSALQEIATLLPKTNKDSGTEKIGSGDADVEEKGDGDGDGGENVGKTGGQSANSKASTVELAIEYIKQLKREVEEATKRAEEAEKKLAATTKIEEP